MKTYIYQSSTIALNLSIVLIASCIIFLISSDGYTAPKTKTTSISSHDLILLTATDLAQKIKSRKVTSLEVVNAFIAQIDKHNEKLNAIATIDKEGARKRAIEADQAIAQGEIWGPLHGVPVTIKDNIATMGIRTTCGFPPLAQFVPDADAILVDKLKKAGAIILGKTNMPIMASDCQTNNPIFGKTNNPWDISKTCGGSSGGGATAIAAGLSPLDIGNDTGGSIRIPCHFCGIYGLKPTQNIVPLAGMFQGFPTQGFYKLNIKKDFLTQCHLTCNGPLARSIDDLKLALSIIAGPDLEDIDVPSIKLIDTGKKDIKKLRIAWSDNFGNVPIATETSNALQKIINELAKHGCKVEKINPPDFDFALAWNTYGEILYMEGVGPYTPWIIRVFNYVFGLSGRKEMPFSKIVCSMSYEKYMKVLNKRAALVASFDRFIQQYDAFLCPVSSTSAFNHMAPGMFPTPNKEIIVNDKPINYWVANMSYTCVFNLTGNPVVIIPIGYTMQNLPIGVQVVGKRWCDMELLSVGNTIDKLSNAFKHPPNF